MDERKRIVQASSISIPVQQTNAPYMVITMRMFSTRPNKNGDGVTERFIDAVVENQPGHVGLPLYADTKRLRSRDFANLDHQYDPMSGEFLTEEIGSFCAFEKVEDAYGVSLLGEARVYKRSQRVCAA